MAKTTTKQKAFFKEESISRDNCSLCGLYTKVKSPKLDYTGGGRLNALIIGENQGRTEDDRSLQFCGESGQLLREEFADNSLDFEKDFYKVNAVRCRTFSGNANRTPTKKEIMYCRPMLEKTLQRIKPRFILLFGSTAIESFYMKEFSFEAINLWRGLIIPDTRYKAWVMPLFHPSYIIRNEKDMNLYSVFKRDIDRALEFVVANQNTEFPEPPALKPTILTNYNAIVKALTDINNSKEEYLCTFLVWLQTVCLEVNRNILFF